MVGWPNNMPPEIVCEIAKYIPHPAAFLGTCRHLTRFSQYPSFWLAWLRGRGLPFAYSRLVLLRNLKPDVFKSVQTALKGPMATMLPSDRRFLASLSEVSLTSSIVDATLTKAWFLGPEYMSYTHANLLLVAPWIVESIGYAKFANRILRRVSFDHIEFVRVAGHRPFAQDVLAHLVVPTLLEPRAMMSYMFPGYDAPIPARLYRAHMLDLMLAIVSMARRNLLIWILQMSCELIVLNECLWYAKDMETLILLLQAGARPMCIVAVPVLAERLKTAARWPMSTDPDVLCTLIDWLTPDFLPTYLQMILHNKSMPDNSVLKVLQKLDSMGFCLAAGDMALLVTLTDAPAIQRAVCTYYLQRPAINFDGYACNAPLTNLKRSRDAEMPKIDSSKRLCANTAPTLAALNMAPQNGGWTPSLLKKTITQDLPQCSPETIGQFFAEHWTMLRPMISDLSLHRFRWAQRAAILRLIVAHNHMVRPRCVRKNHWLHCPNHYNNNPNNIHMIVSWPTHGAARSEMHNVWHLTMACLAPEARIEVISKMEPHQVLNWAQLGYADILRLLAKHAPIYHSIRIVLPLRALYNLFVEEGDSRFFREVWAKTYDNNDSNFARASGERRVPDTALAFWATGVFLGMDTNHVPTTAACALMLNGRNTISVFMRTLETNQATHNEETSEFSHYVYSQLFLRPGVLPPAMLVHAQAFGLTIGLRNVILDQIRKATGVPDSEAMKSAPEWAQKAFALRVQYYTAA